MGTSDMRQKGLQTVRKSHFLWSRSGAANMQFEVAFCTSRGQEVGLLTTSPVHFYLLRSGSITLYCATNDRIDLR